MLHTAAAVARQGVLVSNAVGHGDVPPGELTPRFVDEAARRRQALALQCGLAGGGRFGPWC
nr:bifunctional adenosylcobinamide kinase/adenosylcobinamide-phosphate guanylyltransferase [Xanthomonas cannabis]